MSSSIVTHPFPYLLSSLSRPTSLPPLLSFQAHFRVCIEAEGWFDEPEPDPLPPPPCPTLQPPQPASPQPARLRNQAMRFGSLPQWATDLMSLLPAHAFPQHVRGLGRARDVHDVELRPLRACMLHTCRVVPPVPYLVEDLLSGA